MNFANEPTSPEQPDPERIALITGASSGIGAAFARHLAAAGYRLVLTARREERLAALAEEIRQQHAVAAEVLPADLACNEGIAHVEQRIANLPPLAMLINNAGFGTSGNFVEVDCAKHLAMIQVHIVASTRLCRAALPAMLNQHRAAIINVSSVAAFLPGPGNANYSASKSYLVTFSKALRTEVAAAGIRVQALCPGFTYTEFHDTAEYAWFDRSMVPKRLWMSADEVVAHSLRALEQSRRVVVMPGFRNRLLVLLYNNNITRSLIAAARRAVMAKRTREGKQ